MVRTLLSKGARIDAKDADYNTPLAYARQNNSREVASFLRKNGAKEFNTPIQKYKNSC